MADQDTAGQSPEQKMAEPASELQAPSQATEQAAGLASAVADAALNTSAQAFEEAQSRLKEIEATTLAAAEPFHFSPNLLRAASPDTTALSHAMTDLNALVFDAWRSNIEATVAHWQRLAGARSLSEVIALNAEFVRKQTDRFTSQSRDLMSATTKANDRSGR